MINIVTVVAGGAAVAVFWYINSRDGSVGVLLPPVYIVVFLGPLHFGGSGGRLPAIPDHYQGHQEGGGGQVIIGCRAVAILIARRSSLRRSPSDPSEAIPGAQWSLRPTLNACGRSINTAGRHPCRQSLSDCSRAAPCAQQRRLLEGGFPQPLRLSASTHHLGGKARLRSASQGSRARHLYAERWVAPSRPNTSPRVCSKAIRSAMSPTSPPCGVPSSLQQILPFLVYGNVYATKSTANSTLSVYGKFYPSRSTALLRPFYAISTSDDL